MILSQANRDASVATLLSRVEETYELILEDKSSSRINATKDILVQIAQKIRECAIFVSTYSETKNFCRLSRLFLPFQEFISFTGLRLGKSVIKETDAKVADYNSALDKLMQDLRDRTLLNIQVDVQQIREDLSLDSMVCAGQVGLIKGKKCLDGTRIEILNEILDWMNNTDPATPPILWLHGQAGRGKSAIAHTIALQAQNLGMLGSCFCFSRARHHEGLHVKLFTTIARHLADYDLRLRQTLAEVIAAHYTLRDTADMAEQWQKFILEPFSQLEGPSSRNVVIVIDALDESGAEVTRRDILDILAAPDAQLPANIRIVLTSRPIMDITQALLASQHVQARSLDDIGAESVTRDITHYISTRLKKLGAAFSDKDLEQLAVKSNGIFEWARLACEYLRPRFGVEPEACFREITSHGIGDARILLDEMYTTFLKDLTQGSPLDKFRSVMRQILWLKEPLSISALDSMRYKFTRKDDHFSVRIILGYMASFLTGTTDLSTPVCPLHASFYDFMLDKKRSGKFFINEADVHHQLALASLCVMQDGLQFNICGLETSYVRNAAVTDLSMKIEKNIPMHLLYSCRFWATHLHDCTFGTDLAKGIMVFVSGEKILFWMEVLGVCKYIGEADRALTSVEGWLQVSVYIAQTDWHAENEVTGKTRAGGYSGIHSGWHQVCTKFCWCDF